MSILIKHILRNIKDKKLMSALIVVSIAISGALLFVALSIGNVMDTVVNEFDSVSMVFYLIFFVTCFMSVFVVYSSFKYIMALRIKTIGTFKSIGAGKRQTGYLLLCESIVYGLIAAIAAVGAGILLLTILSERLSNGEAKITISGVNILISIIFCIILSVACSYIPIKASEKFSVKEIILQTSTVKEKKRLPYLLIGSALIIIGLLLIIIPELKYEEIFIYFSLVSIFTGFVISVGAVIYYIFALTSKTSQNSFSLKNLKHSKSYRNIAALIAIAVTAVFMVNGANAILVKATDESFLLYNYDIQITGLELNDTLIDKINLKDGITAAAGIFLKEEVEIKDQIPLMTLYGISRENQNKFFNFTTLTFNESVPEKGIILSSDYMERQNMKVGDKIIIGNTGFTIYGTVKEMFNSGNVGFISEDNFKNLFPVENYSLIIVQSSNANKTAASLRSEYENLTTATVGEMLARVKSINADLFTTLNYIIVLSTIAGVFGVLNNLLIAFNSQKRERALLRSLGMSKQKSAFSIILQSLITGLIGGLLGILGGMLLVTTIPAVMLTFEFSAVSVPFPITAAALCVGCSVAICGFASLISLVSNSKTNIVQTLREEAL